MADHYDIDLGEDMQEATIIIQGAMRALQLSNDDVKQIDFDDMIYMPLIKRLRTKFGRMHVFLDEAQDLSRTRQVLARKFVASRGRMYIVGDDRQAIYGFSGADADALHNLIKELDCETFPLNITWRCPVSVVNLAKSIVPDFTSAPEAPEGAVSVVQLKGKDPLPSFLPTDVIMCRNNKPLVSLALTLLKNRVPCKMEGRGIGQSLVALCKRWKIKNIAPFITKLEDYREREIGKAKAKRRENKIEEINDKVDALKTIALQVQSEGNTLLIAVIDFINSLFADDVANVLTLCSYHRSKGREWQNVYLLNHYSYSPSKGARLPWQVVQEQNLAYVAFTRAQSTLTFLNLPE
jgi:superfamily I DNA/RNA helicase